MAPPLIEKVEAYRCSVCRELILGTEEQALRHARSSAGRRLPIGLIYTWGSANDSSYTIIRAKGRKIRYKIHKEEVVVQDGHTWEYSIIGFYYSNSRCPNHPDGCPPRLEYNALRETSAQFKFSLGNGQRRLLGKEEFERVSEDIRPLIQRFLERRTISIPRKLVRTTPELEALVQQG